MSGIFPENVNECSLYVPMTKTVRFIYNNHALKKNISVGLGL